MKTFHCQALVLLLLSVLVLMGSFACGSDATPILESTQDFLAIDQTNVIKLPSGGKTSSGYVKSNSWDMYSIDVTGPSVLTVSYSTSFSSNVKVYVRKSSQPTTNSYDYLVPSSTTQAITTFSNSTYYIGVYGSSSATSTSYTLSVYASGVDPEMANWIIGVIVAAVIVFVLIVVASIVIPILVCCGLCSGFLCCATAAAAAASDNQPILTTQQHHHTNYVYTSPSPMNQQQPGYYQKI